MLSSASDKRQTLRITKKRSCFLSDSVGGAVGIASEVTINVSLGLRSFTGDSSPRPALEQRVDEGGDRRSLREQDQAAKQEQHENDGEQPELLALPHKSPQLQHELCHCLSPSFPELSVLP